MRILVVEDEPGIRAFLVEGLTTGIGAEVDASEGGDAVELARRGYDVILTDMHLSEDLDGLAVIREITGFDRRVRFIVMTGKKRLDVARKLVTAIKGNQVVSFLFKPFELEELLIAVRRAGEQLAAVTGSDRND
jgi:two-component system OmpR family response regulator